MSYSLINRLINLLKRLLFRFCYAKGFRFFGLKACLVAPDRIEGQKFISIGNNTTINTKAWLLAFNEGSQLPQLNIGSRCQLGRFIHIVCLRKVTIEDNVLIADKVYITDNAHGYKDVSLPIYKQPLVFLGDVCIGENSWIGENVSIIGAKIGRHSIVGANSIVKGEFPDYCVIVGAPARIVKRYSFESKSWNKTDRLGVFLS
jgi:acetyltransferase-like isoleucine patch superfamily enzyme